MTKGGRLILSKGYGYANTSRRTHMEPIMRSRIGSVSKAVVTLSRESAYNGVSRVYRERVLATLKCRRLRRLARCGT